MPTLLLKLRGKAKRGQYLLDLGRYKWYQSQSPDDVSAFSLLPIEVDTRRCACKDDGSRMGVDFDVPH